MQTIRFDPDNIPPHIGEGRMTVCGSYASSVLHMNVFEEIGGYHGNVLIVHGTDDAIVNYGYSLVADEIYRKHDAQSSLKLIEGGAHGFSDEHDVIACETLKNWIMNL
jgi:pimeloyl-ACP methyl ester carboxylesterase